MRLVDFESGSPHPVDGEITITAVSPEARQRRAAKWSFVVAFVRPEKPIGQGRTECAAWVTQNLARLAPDIEWEYQGEPLRFDLGRLRELYGH